MVLLCIIVVIQDSVEKILIPFWLITVLKWLGKKQDQRLGKKQDQRLGKKQDQRLGKKQDQIKKL